MAYQKTFTYPNGLTGQYVRITAYLWDRVSRSASAHFSLFSTEALAASAPNQPLVPILAKLRLDGAKFDEWLSNAALEGTTPVAQLYAAAKVEPVRCGDFPTVEGQATVFSDAEDV